MSRFPKNMLLSERIRKKFNPSGVERLPQQSEGVGGGVPNLQAALS